MILFLTVYFWLFAALMAYTYLSLLAAPARRESAGLDPAAVVIAGLVSLPGLYLELRGTAHFGIDAWIVWLGTALGFVLMMTQAARGERSPTFAAGGMVASLYLMWYGLQSLH